MKVKELIAELQELPQEMSVNVFDYWKNLFRGGGDNCSDGIEKVTGAQIVPDDETVQLMREEGEEIKQWVAIEYANDDYTEDADPVADGEFAEALAKKSIAPTLLRHTTPALLIGGVVGRSEQLKAFFQEIEKDKTYILNDYYKNKAKRLRESL